MKVRRFDPVEGAVALATLVPIVLIGIALAYWNLSGWLFLPWYAAMFVWLVGYQRWFARRHPPQPPEDEHGQEE